MLRPVILDIHPDFDLPFKLVRLRAETGFGQDPMVMARYFSGTVAAHGQHLVGRLALLAGR
jgi:hypothetical protein